MNTLTDRTDSQSANETAAPCPPDLDPVAIFNEIKQDRSLIILCALFVIMGLFSILFIRGSIRVGAEAMWNGYKDSYESEKDTTYNAIYQQAFESAEHDYHVRNRIAISIGDLRETANLEVLKVTDVEYVVETGNDNGNSIYSWLEVPGEGVFVVDLQVAEFIIDDARAFVRVRAPFPQLTNVQIDMENVKKLLFKDEHLIGNGSFKDGEELAKTQFATAVIKIKREFASNQYFYKSAQNAAINTIQCLVKQLNPSIPDLVVEVEFF